MAQGQAENPIEMSHEIWFVSARWLAAQTKQETNDMWHSLYLSPSLFISICLRFVLTLAVHQSEALNGTKRVRRDAPFSGPLNGRGQGCHQNNLGPTVCACVCVCMRHMWHCCAAGAVLALALLATRSQVINTDFSSAH